jgi:hypothetical protein
MDFPTGIDPPNDRKRQSSHPVVTASHRASRGPKPYFCQLASFLAFREVRLRRANENARIRAAVGRQCNPVTN